MPAINKKTILKKAGKPKLISSQLGVTAVQKKPHTKHSYNPVKTNRGLVFIKNIPHGFYEEQLKSYFEQFGQVTRTRVARSHKTGKSNGYAFVEFKVPEVAQIAAETMDNYLMFKQNLKTAYIAPENQKFNYFRDLVHTKKDADGVSHLVTPKTQRTEKAIKKINTMPTKKQHDNRVERALYKLKKAQEALAKKNIAIDVSLAGQNQDTTGGKKLSKKEAKIAKLAKKEEAKNRKDTTLQRLLNETIPEGVDESDESFSPEDGEVADLKTVLAKKLNQKSKKNTKKHDTTLDRLLNETIPDGVDESDESFVLPEDESDSVDTSPVQVETSNKRKRAVADSKVNTKKSKSSSVSSAETSEPTKKSKKNAAAAASVAPIAKKTKAKSNKKPAQPESSEDGDDEFTASSATSTNASRSSSSSAASSSSSSAVSSSPVGKKNKKANKNKAAPLATSSSAESSPEVAPKKKSSSNLIANGGIQKRKHTIVAAAESKNKKKAPAANKDLLLGATKLCNKVQSAALKKKKKAQ